MRQRRSTGQVLLTGVLCGVGLLSALNAAAQSDEGAANGQPPVTSENSVPPQTASTADGISESTSSTGDGLERRTVVLDGGGRLTYLLSLPTGYDAAREHSLVLMLPPGTQTEELARAAFTRYADPALRDRGYIVVVPIARGADAGFTGAGFELLPPLLDHLQALFAIAGRRVHLCGVQSGGRAAFQLAMARPELVASLTVLPGLPPDPADSSGLAVLEDVSVTLFVGSLDARWRGDAERTHQTLQAAGVGSNLVVVDGDGNMLSKVDSAALADAIDRKRLEIAGTDPESAIAAMLDDWHAAAANADEQAYFAHFASDESIFMGTDATERWDAAAFRAWAKPYFERGRAWSFKAVERHVRVGPSGDVAWFDEVLDTPNMGPCRGTGVAVLKDGRWRVEHYNLSIPIPNGIVDGVVDQIRRELEVPAEIEEPGSGEGELAPAGNAD